MGNLLARARHQWSRMPQDKKKLVTAAGFVVALGLVGSIIIQANAATYSVALEAENGSLSGNRSAGPTAGASNNQSVRFGGSATPTPTPTPSPTPTPPTPTPTPTPNPTPGDKRLYLTPATGNYATGSTFTVEVRADSLTEGVSSAQVNMLYSANNLEFQSVDVTGSDYSGLGGCPADLRTISSGVVQLTCFYKVVNNVDSTPLTGDRLIAKLNFKVTAAGSGTVDIQDTSAVMSVANSTNVITKFTDGLYTLR